MNDMNTLWLSNRPQKISNNMHSVMHKITPTPENAQRLLEANVEHAKERFASYVALANRE